MAELHPIAVHFPIVLALLWPLIDGLGLFTKKHDLSRLAGGLLGLAVVSSLFATITGQAAFDAAVAAGAVAPEILRTHTDDADRLPWALLALGALRFFGGRRFGDRGKLAAVALGLLLYPYVIGVGRSGGTLVYEHGVGVRGALPAGRSAAN